MAKARKDNKGRALRKGESQRTDNTYVYTYTDPFKKRRFVYAKDLQTLRQKEADLIKNQLDGLDVYVAGSATLNFVFDRYMSTKYDLRKTTRSNYNYMYDHFVKKELGQRRLKDIRKSDVCRFYNSLLDAKRLKVNTLDSIHTVIHQLFNLAVEDLYIRINPSDGVMGECKRAHNMDIPKRHALTIPQQEAFIRYTGEVPKYQHWKPLFTFFLGTGCRVSEVVGIRWDDVHMEEGYIDINHNMVYYQRDEGKCYFSVTTTKTEAGSRIIPMLPEVKQALLDEKAYQKEVGLVCQANIDGYTILSF